MEALSEITRDCLENVHSSELLPLSLRIFSKISGKDALRCVCNDRAAEHYRKRSRFQLEKRLCTQELAFG